MRAAHVMRCVLSLLALSSRAALAQATVVGVVFDSLFTKAPMKGATVVIPELSRYVTSDDRGRFRFDSVPAGRYTMTFLHSSLDSLDIAAEVLPVTVPPSGTINTRLATPSPSGLVWFVCREVSDTLPAMMLGRVRDVDDSAAIAGATVSVSWSELVLEDDALRRRTTQAAAHARADGTFVMCGLPGGLRIDVRVEAGGYATGTLALAPGATVVRRHDFALGRRNPSATIAGVVRDQRSRPAARATVTLRGPAPVSAWTDDAGRFVLDGVPTGTQSFEVRQPGTWPTLAEVDVPGRGRRDVELSLGVRHASRGPVSPATPPAAADPTGFSDRRDAGIGTFITAEEIVSLKLKSLAAAMLQLSPLVVGGTVRKPSRALELVMRAEHKPVGEVVLMPIVNMRVSRDLQCLPNYFVNGVGWTASLPGQAQMELQSVVDLSIVQGIEVYTPSAIPSMFDRHTPCGSVLIWTR
ncbi:MAG: carboxypeptidase regulatory-like domain-containing protein [Gemmatimonadales bacterium]